MYACILIFFTSNMIEGQLISTGAFEVSLNGMSVEVFLVRCLQHSFTLIGDNE